MDRTTRDRFIALSQSNAYNGIDFVEVVQNPSPEPPDLRVHFINTVGLGDTGAIATISGGDSVPTVAVDDVAAGNWSDDAEGPPLLTLHVPDRRRLLQLHAASEKCQAGP